MTWKELLFILCLGGLVGLLVGDYIVEYLPFLGVVLCFLFMVLHINILYNAHKMFQELKEGLGEDTLDYVEGRLQGGMKRIDRGVYLSMFVYMLFISYLQFVILTVFFSGLNIALWYIIIGFVVLGLVLFYIVLLYMDLKKLRQELLELKKEGE